MGHDATQCRQASADPLMLVDKIEQSSAHSRPLVIADSVCILHHVSHSRSSSRYYGYSGPQHSVQWLHDLSFVLGFTQSIVSSQSAFSHSLLFSFLPESLAHFLTLRFCFQSLLSCTFRSVVQRHFPYDTSPIRQAKRIQQYLHDEAINSHPPPGSLRHRQHCANHRLHDNHQ